MVKRGILAGTFDPITIGHAWMMQQGSDMFDELIVGIGVNPAKKPMFDANERKDMILSTAAEMGLKNVTVTIFTGKFLIHHARDHGARYILRGMRDTNDFNYEAGLLHINEKIDPTIQTVFLMPPAYLREVSSSVVKSLIGFDGWEEVVRGYVSDSVFKKLIERCDYSNKGEDI